MANIFLKRDDSCVPKGWRNWAFVNNFIWGKGESSSIGGDDQCDGLDVPSDNIQLLNDAPFPSEYLPAKAFWLESVISHCVFVWKFLKPPEMLSEGGDSEITEEYDCYEKDKHVYGIGIDSRDPVSNSDYYNIDAPEMGYCVGDVFKQHLYTHLRLEETIEEDTKCEGSNTVVKLYGTPTLQVLQNSRLKQIYVYEGTVKGYSCEEVSDGIECFIDIGLEVGAPSTVIGTSITIKGKDHAPVVVTVEDTEDDGILKVTAPTGDDIPQAGDYYTLNRAWCIEDPFLMSGFWLDNESEAGSDTSGLDLFVTTHNSPFETGSFMGAYVWSDLDAPVSSYPDMCDSGGNEWEFLWYGNTNSIFPEEQRFKEKVSETDADRCGDTYKEQIEGYLSYSPRQKASASELSVFLEKNNFIRVEIQTGGSRTRHNWFAPALKDQYIKVDGAIYKIINHITSHIIDISKTSVDGNSEISIDSYSTYEIINQKSWMLIEHYDGNEFKCHGTEAEPKWGESDGLFKGSVYSLSYNSSNDTTQVTLDVDGDHCGAWIKNAPPTSDFPGDPPPEWARYNTANNFINRYKQTHTHASSEPEKQYKKFDNWKLVRTYSAFDPSENPIQDFSIDPNYFNLDSHPDWPFAFNPYTLEIFLKGNATESLYEGDECFVAFSDTFKTVCSDREGKYYLDFGSSLRNDKDSSDREELDECRDEGETAPLCLDGGYISNQYLIDIPPDYRIGYCEGRYYGLNGCAAITYDCYNNNSVFEDYGLYLHISTSSSSTFNKSGISSLQGILARQDWVAYRDVNNQKLQLRIGEDDFQTRPTKSEFAIGDFTSETLTGSGGQYTLNDYYDRLNKIKFDLPSGGCPPISFSVCLGDYDGCTTHGFAVGGRGDISLRPLLGCDEANWTDAREGKISPILVSKALGTTTTALSKVVPLGTRTSVDHIEISDAPATVTGYYVSDDQTIRKDMGFFDLMKVSDGEVYLLFNQDVGPFKSGEEYPIWDNTLDPATNAIENSPVEDNVWDKQSGVMMIGTFDEGKTWGTPYVDKDQIQPDEFLMILNSVEYLTSLYDSVQRRFGVFVRCSSPVIASSDEEDFIGFFSVSYLTLAHKAYNCEPIKGDETEGTPAQGDTENPCCDEKTDEELEFDTDTVNRWEF